MDLGVPELLIILVLVVILFGVGRIGKVAGELGSGIRAFREGLQGELDKPEQAEVKSEPVEVKSESKEEDKPA